MWWSEQRNAGRLLRLAVVLAAAGLTAGCFQPLYGRGPTPEAESVHDKLGAILISNIPTHQGTEDQRVAVSLHNALQYDLNGNAGAIAPTHRLDITIKTTSVSVIIDPVSGRATAQIDGVTAYYQLVEIATGKVVLKDSAYAHADFDSPGSQQRFATARASRDAEDRAVNVVAEAIRNRLASYFVAGT